MRLQKKNNFMALSIPLAHLLRGDPLLFYAQPPFQSSPLSIPLFIFLCLSLPCTRSVLKATLRMHLSELRRCQEENGQAFFVGLLGQCYGEVPALQLVPQGIVDMFGWVPNTSLVHMEILNGELKMEAMLMHIC